MTVNVVGLSRLRRDLRAVGGDLADLKEANAKAARIVEAEAERIAPRRSGRLRSSIRSSKAASRASVAAGRASVPYAAPIHWGWPRRGIEANPFLTDAARKTEHQWLPAYEADLEQIAHQLDGNTY